MQLLRVRVPDFRVLKDVDITFEKEFSPRIFPLGSQNGGGKSTLLQLIFALLHCSNSEERLSFLENMFSDFKPVESEIKRVLAVIDIWDGEKEVELEFFSCRESYPRKLGKDEANAENNGLSLSALPEPEAFRRVFSDSLPELRAVASGISELRREIYFLSKNIGDKLDSIKAIEDDDERVKRYVRLILSFNLKRQLNLSDQSTIQECEREIERKLSTLTSDLKRQDEIYKTLKIQEYLQSENLIYVSKYSANGDTKEKIFLLCTIENMDINNAQTFLSKLSERTFLVAPYTQVYLFLPQNVRKRLFKEKSPEGEDYYSKLEEAKSALPGFFTYDFFPVELTIKSLKAARDEDTRELIEAGDYGNRFKSLLLELNSVLPGKRLDVGGDLSEIMFKADKGDEVVELYPEDMSHGELKRLSLYMWIKYHQIEDAIVLMDEIEIALHPDWQYQIVRDLMQWTPNNQYILATHSFDLCEALTPAHVKELEPKLLKRTSD